MRLLRSGRATFTMEHTQRRDVRVPGISAITDPADALARVAIVVLA